MRNTTLRTFTYTNPSCYPIEAALLREPNLWVPDKKPVGPVKVDWDNPITAGLVVCVLPRSSDRYLTYTNYADPGNPATVGGTAPTIDPIGVGNGGEYVLCHPQGGINGVDSLYCKQKEAVANTDDMTGIEIKRLLTTSPGNTSGIWRGVGGDSFRIASTSTTNLRVSYIDNVPTQYNADLTINTLTSTNKIHFWGGRKKGNAVHAYALDDSVFKKSTGIIFLGTSTFRDDGAVNQISFVGDTNTAWTLHGWIYASFVWKRALSDSEIESVFRDPYQFLIPA